MVLLFDKPLNSKAIALAGKLFDAPIILEKEIFLDKKYDIDLTELADAAECRITVGVPSLGTAVQTLTNGVYTYTPQGWKNNLPINIDAIAQQFATIIKDSKIVDNPDLCDLLRSYFVFGAFWMQNVLTGR